MVSLAELENLRTEIDIAVATPEEYVGNEFAPLPEGTYDVVIKDWDVSRDQDGTPDGRAIVLKELEIVSEGPHQGRPIRNQRVWTTPFQRNGVTVSGLGDLIRGIDDKALWSTLAEAGAIIQKAQDGRLPIRAKFQWEAYDRDYFEAQGGPMMAPKSAEQKAARKAATIKGMRNFKQAPDGTYLAEIIGPSGATLEAEIRLDRVIASSKCRN